MSEMWEQIEVEVWRNL